MRNLDQLPNTGSNPVSDKGPESTVRSDTKNVFLKGSFYKNEDNWYQIIDR